MSAAGGIRSEMAVDPGFFINLVGKLYSVFACDVFALGPCKGR